MKLLVCCPSGLRIEFEGSHFDLPQLDRFLGEIAEVEARRLELRHQLDIAEQRRDVPPGPSVLDPAPDPPVLAPFVPFPEPAASLTGQPDVDQAAPPAAPGPAALPPVAAGNGADTPAAPPTGEPRPDAPRKKRGRPATSRPLVLQALANLGVTSVPEIVERTGLSAKAVERTLERLKASGEVAHNGCRGGRRRARCSRPLASR